jgi:hypothetical protein
MKEWDTDALPVQEKAIRHRYDYLLCAALARAA